jgi:CRISPR-associated protein Cmr6
MERAARPPRRDPQVRAAGPLGRVLQVVGETVGTRPTAYPHRLDQGANSLVLLHRAAFLDRTGRATPIDRHSTLALLRWAARWNLGQEPDLVASAAGRRERALRTLRRQGLTVVRLRVTPGWRLAVGLGNRANAHETGLSLHGTYGWPAIPGSTLKGLACARALESGADPGRVATVFGLPRVRAAAAHTEADDRPEAEEGGHDDLDNIGDDAGRPRAHRGAVRFLDALPAAEPVRVVLDVLTPHVQPYYADTASDDEREPRAPAEYHSPVPVQFLVVNGGSFAVDLAGPAAEDVWQAAEWCTQALGQVGVGGKTSAGYGYCRVEALPREAQPAQEEVAR